MPTDRCTTPLSCGALHVDKAALVVRQLHRVLDEDALDLTERIHAHLRVEGVLGDPHLLVERGVVVHAAIVAVPGSVEITVGERVREVRAPAGGDHVEIAGRHLVEALPEDLLVDSDIDPERPREEVLKVLRLLVCDRPIVGQEHERRDLGDAEFLLREFEMLSGHCQIRGYERRWVLLSKRSFHPIQPHRKQGDGGQIAG